MYIGISTREVYASMDRKNILFLGTRKRYERRNKGAKEKNKERKRRGREASLSTKEISLGTKKMWMCLCGSNTPPPFKVRLVVYDDDSLFIISTTSLSNQQ